MHEDDLKRLLQDIDGVECDMRRLESRLTSVRERIYKAVGPYARFGVDGQPKRRSEEAESSICPF